MTLARLACLLDNVFSLVIAEMVFAPDPDRLRDDFSRVRQNCAFPRDHQALWLVFSRLFLPSGLPEDPNNATDAERLTTDKVSANEHFLSDGGLSE